MASSESTPLPDSLNPSRFSPFERLFEQRVLFLRGPLVENNADAVAARMIALDAESNDDISLYIDSPGGEMYGMFALHDTIQLLGSTVHTRCVGVAASAAAVLLATGTGTRSATENARIMVHQPMGASEGSAEDIRINAEEAATMRRRMEELLAERTGQPLERVQEDTNRDFWLSAPEAVEYGLIDEVATRNH